MSKKKKHKPLLKIETKSKEPDKYLLDVVEIKKDLIKVALFTLFSLVVVVALKFVFQRQ